MTPIILQHDNARPHTSCTTEEALRNLKFQPIPHPPYSPDLAPCDFYFFPLLKRDLKGNHYTTDNEVKAAVESWIREKLEEFFSDGMKQLVTRWEKCVSLNGDYVEK
ncbi:Histone-lysine N-methyltransferase SETMAR [Anthophora retusa]